MLWVKTARQDRPLSGILLEETKADEP
jgi:hypothetical protein